MNNIVNFLKEKKFVGSDRYDTENDIGVISIQDFFCEERRVTIVELVDKYQVMVYDGKYIHGSNQLESSHAVLSYLKGIL